MKAHEAGSLTLSASIIAIGAFDGVHRGHQAVIRQTVADSKRMGVPSVVYTFDPPPRCYFQGVRMLTSLEERLERLARLGTDFVVIARFDEAYIRRRAVEFLADLRMLNPLGIMVGADFRFGQNREGDVHLLARHFRVSVAEPVCCPAGDPISSTRIRQLLAMGDVQASGALLGWPIERRKSG